MSGRQLAINEAAEVILARRAARTRFADFSKYLFPDELPARHHEYVCDALDEVADNVGKDRSEFAKGEWKRDRLMIFLPPGSAKSTYSSIRFPPYYLGKFPRNSIIAASYGEKLSTAFGRKVRNIIKSPGYQKLFDTRIAEDAQAKGEWATQHDGSYFAAGVGSGITGRRSDLGLIDDPVKGRKDADSWNVREEAWNWYTDDFFSRLKPNAAQIIIQTRWHIDDLSGRILGPDWNGESGDFVGFDGEIWRVICIPAEAREDDPLGREPGEWLWPEYYTPAVWETIKNTQTKQGKVWRTWNSLYQQTPRPEEGAYFQREWFEDNRYDLYPNDEKALRYREVPPVSIYAASDYAVLEETGDATEHGIGGFDTDDHLWLVDWWSGHKTADVWIENQLDLAKEWKPLVWAAEVGVIRRAIEPFLKKAKRRRGVFFRNEWLPHVGDKGAHARSFQALSAAGMVHIPRTEWGDQLIDQLVSFVPGTDYEDDKVDVCGLFGRILETSFAPAKMGVNPQRIKADSYGQKMSDYEEDAEELNWILN